MEASMNPPKKLSDIISNNGKFPVIRTSVVLVDVIGYSKLSSGEQLTLVLALQDSLRSGFLPAIAAASGLQPKDVVSGFVPTGDGFYCIVEPPLASWGPLLGLGVRNFMPVALKQTPLASQKIRVAVHYGDIVPFYDMADKVNYVGDGMNECARLFNPIEPAKEVVYKIYSEFASGEDWVVVSTQALEQFVSTIDDDDWFQRVQWRTGDEIKITVKHDEEMTCLPIEINRYIAVAPPRKKK